MGGPPRIAPRSFILAAGDSACQTAGAAAAAPLGVIPFMVLGSVPVPWLSGAYALASGFMLGVGYILMAKGLLGQEALPPILGAKPGGAAAPLA